MLSKVSLSGSWARSSANVATSTSRETYVQFGRPPLCVMGKPTKFVLLLLGATMLSSCSKIAVDEAPATPTQAVTVAPATLKIVPGKSIGLPKATSATQVILERVGEVWSPLIHQPVPVKQKVPMECLGWAVDEQTKTSAGAVDVLLDGMPFAAEYPLERGDVADFLKVPGYKLSGFKITLPPEKLEKGPHEIAVRVISKDGKRFYPGPRIALSVE